MLFASNMTLEYSGNSRGYTSETNPFTFPDIIPRQMETSRRRPSAGGEQSLISRRPRSQALPPLMISGRRRATHVELGWGRRGRGRVDEDVVEEGKELFCNFVHQQANSQDCPQVAERLGDLTPVSASYSKATLVQIGRELRHIAQSLENCPQRQRVKRRAAQVSPNITRAAFKSLLAELFAAGGITRERIVVLFLFCSDVSLRWLTREDGEGGSGVAEAVCCQFLKWSLSFISDSVCAWVRSHGGWRAVMSTGVNPVSVSLALAGAIFIGYGVYKYIKNS